MLNVVLCVCVFEQRGILIEKKDEKTFNHDAYLGAKWIQHTHTQRNAISQLNEYKQKTNPKWMKQTNKQNFSSSSF